MKIDTKYWKLYRTDAQGKVIAPWSLIGVEAGDCAPVSNEMLRIYSASNFGSIRPCAVPSDQYAQAAQEALSKLSPEERAAFVKMLQDRAAAHGVTLPGNVAPEPKDLGQVLTDLHKKPGQLRDMLGGGAVQPQAQASGSSPITDILSSPMAKAVLAGIAAMVVKRVMNQRA
jgi:hypothetical protein